jgi:hypothetical protein
MATKTITLNTETIQTLLTALSAAYGAACDALPRHKMYVTNSSKRGYVVKLGKAIDEFKIQVTNAKDSSLDEIKQNLIEIGKEIDKFIEDTKEFVPPPGEFSGCRCPYCPEKQSPKRKCFCCEDRRISDRFPDEEPAL